VEDDCEVEVLDKTHLYDLPIASQHRPSSEGIDDCDIKEG